MSNMRAASAIVGEATSHNVEVNNRTSAAAPTSASADAVPFYNRRGTSLKVRRLHSGSGSACANRSFVTPPPTSNPRGTAMRLVQQNSLTDHANGYDKDNNNELITLKVPQFGLPLMNGDASKQFSRAKSPVRRMSLFQKPRNWASAEIDDAYLQQKRGSLSHSRALSPANMMSPIMDDLHSGDDAHGDIGFVRYSKEKDLRPPPFLDVASIASSLSGSRLKLPRSGYSGSELSATPASGHRSPSSAIAFFSSSTSEAPKIAAGGSGPALDSRERSASLTVEDERSSHHTPSPSPSRGSGRKHSLATVIKLPVTPATSGVSTMTSCSASSGNQSVTGSPTRPATLQLGENKAANKANKASEYAGVDPRRPSLNPSTTSRDSENSLALPTRARSSIDKSCVSDIYKSNGTVNSAPLLNHTGGGHKQTDQRLPLTPLGFRKRISISSRRTCKRLVHKNGECNISHINVPKQSRKFLSDIFTTLIDVKWRWSLLIFSGAFLLSWTAFAVVYYLIALSHGDFHLHGEVVEDWKPCIMNIETFSSVFLFSVETQHTIGYGYRFITEDCPAAMVTVCIQSIVGIMIQSFMTGFVFAKLARPKKRAETLIFSKNAVISVRDGKLCFLYRVGDMRKSHIVEAHVRLQMIKKRLTKEGELLPFHQFDMNVGFDEGMDRIFLVWPITICHVIDEDSPLYDYSAEELASAKFEIVAILEGIVESTGMTTQARTSYLPSEILWGQRFEKLVTYQRDNGEYKIDFARFHSTYPVETPTCSAKELEEMAEAGIYPVDYENENEDTELEHDDSSYRISPDCYETSNRSRSNASGDGRNSTCAIAMSPSINESADEQPYTHDEKEPLLLSNGGAGLLRGATGDSHHAKSASVGGEINPAETGTPAIGECHVTVEETQSEARLRGKAKASVNQLNPVCDRQRSLPTSKQSLQIQPPPTIIIRASSSASINSQSHSTASVAAISPGKHSRSSIMRHSDIM